MSIKKIINSVFKILFCCLIIYSCNPGDARKIPPNAKDRVKGKNSGEFDFASSNELWRATLDTLDFMPLALANYSGGIIVTDWYSDKGSNNESVKISIRFLSNEIRSDALAVKVFYKKCSMQNNCEVTDRSGDLSADLSKKILTKASIYKKENKSKNKKKYINSQLEND